MWRFRERLSSFFYGRYGNDKFNIALLILYVVLAVVNVIVRNLLAIRIFFLLQWMVLVLVLFRSLSRNIPARRKENEWFERNFSFLINWFKLASRRVKDIKYKRYRKCPYCKAVIRLPIKKGTHSVKCPSCKTNFKVNNLF